MSSISPMVARVQDLESSQKASFCTAQSQILANITVHFSQENHSAIVHAIAYNLFLHTPKNWTLIHREAYSCLSRIHRNFHLDNRQKAIIQSAISYLTPHLVPITKIRTMPGRLDADFVASHCAYHILHSSPTLLAHRKAFYLNMMGITDPLSISPRTNCFCTAASVIVLTQELAVFGQRVYSKHTFPPPLLKLKNMKEFSTLIQTKDLSAVFLLGITQGPLIERKKISLQAIEPGHVVALVKSFDRLYLFQSFIGHYSFQDHLNSFGPFCSPQRLQSMINVFSKADKGAVWNEQYEKDFQSLTGLSHPHFLGKKFQAPAPNGSGTFMGGWMPLS